MRKNQIKTDMSNLLCMPDDVDQLPKKDIEKFVDQFAREHNISFQRSKLDDWSEAVTRAAGDEVRLDRTEKLLVALKKQNLINGRQAARLLTNYMREAVDVRSIQRFRERGLSSQH